MMRMLYVFSGVCIVCMLMIATLLFAGGETSKAALHSVAHDTGLCEGASCDVSIATVADNIACATDGASCAPTSAAVADVSDLTADEQKVVAFIADQIAKDGRTQFDGEEIEEATGVNADVLDGARLQNAVIVELNRRNFNLGLLANAGNCAKFSACSIDRNLMGASGEELARYQAEKDEDGKAFVDLTAPVFTLPMTDGNQVSLAGFSGSPVALVTLSVHCFHSMDTLPLLANLREKYNEAGIQILPIFVNATSVEDIRDTIDGLELDFPVAVAEGKALSEAYNSRMVPSTFLIDDHGHIVKKLVGQKDETTLDQALSELVLAQAASIGMVEH